MANRFLATLRFARNDGVRVWKKGKRGAAKPLPFFPSPLKTACHPEPSARDLLAT